MLRVAQDILALFLNWIPEQRKGEENQNIFKWIGILDRFRPLREPPHTNWKRVLPKVRDW
jgi:hypothetical protein